MTRLTILAAILAALTVACGDKDDTNDTNNKDHSGHDHAGHDHSGHDHGDGGANDDDGAADADTGSSKIDEAMKGLSDADQKLARAQRICPVSDEPLGDMGTPIKLDVKGKAVFICCAGCKKRILNNPDKYLAKLK